MDQPPYLLDQLRREAVLGSLLERSAQRGWALLAAHVRTNHVHVVLESEATPERVMNDLKSYASRCLNRAGFDTPGRKRWARHGSTRWLRSWCERSSGDSIRDRKARRSYGDLCCGTPAVRPGTWVTLLSEDIGNTFCSRVQCSGLDYRNNRRAGGNVEPRQAIGSKGGEGWKSCRWDFQAFLGPSFPRAGPGPAYVSARRARHDESACSGARETQPDRTVEHFKNSADQARSPQPLIRENLTRWLRARRAFYTALLRHAAHHDVEVGILQFRHRVARHRSRRRSR